VRAEDRKELLLAQAEQFLVVEAENVRRLPEVFLPLYSHRLALRREVVVVLGGRGAGKSALFRLLNELGDSANVRSFFGEEVPEATWLEAFSDGAAHPQQAELDAFATRASDAGLRAFWLTHLVRRLAAGAPAGTEPLPPELGPMWSLDRPENQVGLAARLLDATEARLAGTGRTVFATYDHLDRLGQFDRGIRLRFVSTLLALWLSLSNRYGHLRAKIFLREDLFESAQSTFADAGKLRGRSTSIEWDVPSLYQLVVRYVAASGEEARDWLSEVPGLELRPWKEFGHLPPEMDERLQKAFAERLAGKLMGTGVKKGYTYRWIPNRLQDGRGRIVPRSVLNLIGYACGEARRRPLRRGARLLTPQDLWAALQPTSKARVSEVSEEFPPVKRLESLRGEQVLLDKVLVIRRLDQRLPDEGPHPRVSGEDVFEELVRLGVLIVRDDRYGKGRIDVPDLYRYGFGILRKGGVRRPS
jgi:hypothetical protein